VKHYPFEGWAIAGVREIGERADNGAAAAHILSLKFLTIRG